MSLALEKLSEKLPEKPMANKPPLASIESVKKEPREREDPHGSLLPVLNSRYLEAR